MSEAEKRELEELKKFMDELLVEEDRMSINDIASMLDELELEGLVKRVDNKN